jgi:hypothetical protein
MHLNGAYKDTGYVHKSNDVCVHQYFFPVLFLLVFVATSLLSGQLFGLTTPGGCGRRSRRTVTPLMVVRTLVPWPRGEPTLMRVRAQAPLISLL